MSVGVGTLPLSFMIVAPTICQITTSPIKPAALPSHDGRGSDNALRVSIGWIGWIGSPMLTRSFPVLGDHPAAPEQQLAELVAQLVELRRAHDLWRARPGQVDRHPSDDAPGP